MKQRSRSIVECNVAVFIGEENRCAEGGVVGIVGHSDVGIKADLMEVKMFCDLKGYTVNHIDLGRHWNRV